MTTLVLPRALAETLRSLASQPTESAGVLACAVLTGEGGLIKLIATEYTPVPDDSYDRRDAHGLTVRSEGYVHALKDAARHKHTALWLHTHPGPNSSTQPSLHDRRVDHEVRDLFASRTGSGRYGAIVIGEGGSTRPFQYTGFVEGVGGGEIDRIIILDSGIELVPAEASAQPEVGEIQSRHVIAFGDQLPKTLASLRFAVVGCGGTGSAVAEQLVRLGARNVLLIDDDKLSLSNTTRVYGSTPADVDRDKVDVLHDHLIRIAPEARVEVVKGRITEKDVALRLVEADVVFGCTDDNSGRLRLARFAYIAATLTIDMGVQIEPGPEGKIRGIHGRLTVMHPGAPCLLCRGRIDLQRAAAEERTAAENKRLAAEGYAPGLTATEPAVVAYTTAVAAAAISELIERLVGYGALPRPSEILLRFHDREVRLNDGLVRAGCYCDPGNEERPLGDVSPFLGVNWIH
jgi:molybdopterin/thiamine biosynthesis adenylyltransferase/proteasome lid subunit RPN8/RPN11